MAGPAVRLADLSFFNLKFSVIAIVASCLVAGPVSLRAASLFARVSQSGFVGGGPAAALTCGEFMRSDFNLLKFSGHRRVVSVVDSKPSDVYSTVGTIVPDTGSGHRDVAIDQLTVVVAHRQWQRHAAR